MSAARPTLGLDRNIRLAWLDAVAAQATLGASPADIRSHLARLLEGQVAGESSGGARDKTITVLMHIWVLVPPELLALRDHGLLLFHQSAPSQRLAIHWGMALATYPFFRDVAATAGLLLDLQGHVTLAQLTRRLTECWGQRSTLTRAARRAARSLVEWGVLQETDERGVYEGAPRQALGHPPVKVWLVEAALRAERAQFYSLRRLIASPALFPFQFSVAPAELHDHPRLDLLRQGLDEDLVTLVSPRR